jgi:hypothetical protein
MYFLINYANNKYLNSQKICTKSAYENGFNKVFECGISDISNDFLSENYKILSNSRGAGYWLWKPYIILEHLKCLNDGDFMFYCDSGAMIVSNISNLINVFYNKKQDIMPFNIADQTEIKWTKRDLLKYLDVDYPEYINTPQINAAFQLIRKSELSIEFYRRYLNCAKIEKLITDYPSESVNHPDFIEHRHDQSIFSLLCKKYGFECFRDPSQWGNKYINEYSNSPYKQIIFHHRNQQ